MEVTCMVIKAMRWMEWCGLIFGILGVGVLLGTSSAQAMEKDGDKKVWIVTGVVQYEDLRRVPQATVELRDQEGTVIDTQVTNEGGEFILAPPNRGIYSIRAIQEALSSESTILEIGTNPLM